MSNSRIPSPARSLGPVTPRRYKNRGSRSSTVSGRLSNIADQFKESNKDSFAASPLSKTVLSDNTEIEMPRRQSWWKKVENSRDVIEVLENEEPMNAADIFEEFGVVLTQEKKNYSLNLPDSSGSESIHSIVVPQRKLFIQKENVPQKNYGQDATTSEYKNQNLDNQTIHAGAKNLFGQTSKRTKPVFPSELLQISTDNTVANKTKETVEPKVQIKSLFGNRPATKRRNMFADFVVSESEEEILEIQPKRFTFNKQSEPTRRSSNASSITTDIEMDDWKLLPSSTMMEHPLEVQLTTPGKRARLSKLSEAKESTNTDSTKQSNRNVENSRDNIVGQQTDKTEQENKHTDEPEDALLQQDEGEEIVLTYEDNDPEEVQTDKNVIDDRTKTICVDNKLSKVSEYMDNLEIELSKIVGEKTDHILQIETPMPNKSVHLTNKVVEETPDSKQEEQNDQNICTTVKESPKKEKSQQLEEVLAEEKVHSTQDKENTSGQIVDTARKQKEQIEEQANSHKQTQVIDQKKEVEQDKQIDNNDQEEVVNEDLIEASGEIQNEDEQDVLNDSQDQNKEQDESQVIVEKDDPEQHYGQEDEVEQNESEELEIEENDDQEVEDVNIDASEEVLEDAQHNSQEDDVEQNESEELEIEENDDQEVEDVNIDASEEVLEDAQHNSQEDDVDQNESEQLEIEENDDQEVEDENIDASEEVLEDAQDDHEQHYSQEDDVEQNESEELEIEENDDQEVEDENINASEEDLEDVQNEDEPQQSDDKIDVHITHDDTTGTNRKKRETNTPEAILHNATNEMDSFTGKGRNTSIRKTKSILRNLTIQQSMAPARESTGLSDGTKNCSAEGSGWDSHRTTRKTLRQTFGRDFTPRKSLRTLVMEKSAKRQTLIKEANAELRHQANSTELPNDHDDEMDYEDNVEAESDHEVSRRTRQAELEMYFQKLKKENRERKQKIEEEVRNSFKANAKSALAEFSNFKFRTNKLSILRSTTKNALQAAPKTKRGKPSAISLENLPPELIEDMKYKPPKRFKPRTESWITKRLYKFLESKLEPKYDYKARIRAEKLVETIYSFVRDCKRLRVAAPHTVAELKREMARLDVVRTHFEFYDFFKEYMPYEVKTKVVPDIINDIPLPREGVFAPIIE